MTGSQEWPHGLGKKHYINIFTAGVRSLGRKDGSKCITLEITSAYPKNGVVSHSNPLLNTNSNLKVTCS